MISRLGSLLFRRLWGGIAPEQDQRSVSYVYAIMMMT
jgi:hypothetical protein